MTNIIVGQNISGSLTSTSPTIVDPTSPFNGQFYDDFDVSSVNVIDPSNIPFLLAANKEFGDIGSVKIGETRSTNIFIQPPAGSAPGASTIIQLINTKTNSVDAQAISSSSEALKFVKNAEISGSDYKIRVINPTPGDYEISLAGANQRVQITNATPTVAAGLPPAVIIDPVIGSQPNPNLVFGGGFTGGQPAPAGQPATSGSGSAIDPIIDPLAGNQPIQTSSEEGIPLVLMDKVPSEQTPTVLADNPPSQTPPGSFVLPEAMSFAIPEGQVPPVVDPPVDDNQLTPIRGTNPQPNERGPIITDQKVDPTLGEIDPRSFQAFGGSIPPGASAGISPAILPGPPFILNDNFLTIINGTTGFGINSISKKSGSKVNEIGIFAVDDPTGKINGIAPGAAGYLKAAINSARSIFSTLGGNFFESSSKREIFLKPNTYGFFEVQDGSIADLKQQLASGKVPTNILSSIPDAKGNVPIQVTNNSTTGGYNVSVNNDELVLSVVKLDGATPNIAIGAKSQGLAEGRTIDLTGLTGTLKADITTKSSAAYNNNIGFYVVEDSIGTIKLANGETRKPGDADYAVEAIKNALTNANSSLQAGKTDSKLGQDITGGRIYAPVVVSQGSLSDFVTANPKNIGGSGNNAYFNYVLGNSDKQDHFRLIGDNTFGVEDQLGGGDRDFNDLVINMNVKPA